MAVLRSSVICLVCLANLTLALAAASPAMAQDAAEWERRADKGLIYANLVTNKNDLFGFFCREIKNSYVGGIVMRMPSFRTQIRDEETYSLNIVIDGRRDSIVMMAKDIDLWFEATDLNQQLALGRIFDSVTASHRLDLAISAIGWRGSYEFDGADTALHGLMDRCL